MKKLFFLGFLLLLSLLSFTTSAIAEDAPSDGEVTYLADDSKSDDQDAGSTPEKSSLSDLSEEELLAVNCETFIEAENILDLQEEELYQKQSLFLGNLEFARHSQFRLDPKDTSLEEINNSFLQSDFTEERLASLTEMEQTYSESVTECLTQQKETAFNKEIEELEKTKETTLLEEKANFEKQIKALETREELAITRAENKAAERLAKARAENKAAHKSFKSRVNKSYQAVYSGKRSSIYNKTIVSFENKIKRLPQVLEKKEANIKSNKEKTLKRNAQKISAEKKSLQEEHKAKAETIRQKSDEEKGKKEQEKGAALGKVPEESAAITERVYGERKRSVVEEGKALQERQQYGSDLITYLKYLWQEDRQKQLKKLVPESINLDADSITAEGIDDPLPPPVAAAKRTPVTKPRPQATKEVKQTVKKIKRDKSGQKSEKKLNTFRNKEPDKDKDGSGDFVGNIDRLYKEHNSANGDWDGETLPSYVVAALAEAAGMPGVTMEQVTRGESGAHKKNSARPGASGVDPGGTKGWGLWMITTSFNDDLAKKVGGYKNFLNPVLNAWAAAQIYKSNGLGAWYGTGSVEGDGVSYKGKYDLRNALGGRTYKEVLASYGIGSDRKGKRGK